MYERDGVWHICIRHNGKKIQRSLKIPVGKKEHRKIAEAMESKIRVQLIEENFFDKPIGCNKTFNQMMDKFMKEYAPTLSKNTQKAYGYYAENLKDFFCNQKVDSITPKMVTRYKVQRRENGASSSTINRELYMLSKAFKLAVNEWEWLNQNPVSKVSKETENNERDRWLSYEEEKRLIWNCPEWLSDIIIFDLHTGLRQDELLSLEWTRVDLKQKTILIQKTKNGKPKTIPLNQKAFNVLVKRSKIGNLKNDLVFFSIRGTKFNRFNVKRDFGKVLKKAGIKNFRFHDLRHTFATRLIQKGEDIYKVAKLLGHRNIKSNQRYAHHCSESLRSGVDGFAQVTAYWIR